MAARHSRSTRSRSIVVAIALALGALPAINVAWDVLHDRYPGNPWWHVTYAAGFPAFKTLELVFDEFWVPSGMSHVPTQKALGRWAVLGGLNISLWAGAAALLRVGSSRKQSRGS